MTKCFSWDLFNRMPIIGIMRNVAQNKTPDIAKIYQQSGLTNLEVTMNSAGAAESIALLSSTYGHMLNIGAGTVCSLIDLERALDAGAGFIVTPIINEEVIAACVAKKIPIFPGAYTPTEIYKAWSLGASMVKVFPGTSPAYIKEVLAPLNHIGLSPTGGIRLENFTDYFAAGAKAVGIGSHLFPTEVIGQKDWAQLQAIYQSYTAKYNTYINNK